MTDQTTDLLLEDAARQARDARDAADARLLAERQVADRRTAVELANRVVRDVLGTGYAERITWRPRDTDSAVSYQADGELDGLRLRVSARQYDLGSERLYLLVRCPNPLHPPTDRLVRIHDLPNLADRLDEVADQQRPEVVQERRSWTGCAACEQLREDRVEAVVQQADSAREQLAAAVDRYLDERIGARLDGFLATYLPDRI